MRVFLPIWCVACISSLTKWRTGSSLYFFRDCQSFVYAQLLKWYYIMQMYQFFLWKLKIPSLQFSIAHFTCIRPSQTFAHNGELKYRDNWLYCEDLLYHREFLEHWIAKKVFLTFDDIFHVYLMRGLQKYERNWILTMAFWVTCKIAQPIQPIWQHIFALP